MRVIDNREREKMIERKNGDIDSERARERLRNRERRDTKIE
jgi:hypothetical protein